MELVIISGIAILAVLILVLVLHHEQRDKERRAEQGLPPRKYHDITDCDVATVYTIHHK